METRFQIGQEVRATTSAQGMTAGEVYEVVGASVRETPFGTFVTYQLENYPATQEVLSVGNLHLLAQAVGEAAP
jgi:hypothetical protein